MGLSRMHSRLVDVESVSSFESLATEVAGVEEHPWEMDCLQVISHLGREFCPEGCAQPTVIFLYVVITDDILAQVFHAEGT